MEDVLWNIELPKPTNKNETDMAAKLALYKGSTFDDTFVNDLVEPRVAVEILKLWIIYAKVISNNHFINFDLLLEIRWI